MGALRAESWARTLTEFQAFCRKIRKLSRIVLSIILEPMPDWNWRGDYPENTCPSAHSNCPRSSEFPLWQHRCSAWSRVARRRTTPDYSARAGADQSPRGAARANRAAALRAPAIQVELPATAGARVPCRAEAEARAAIQPEALRMAALRMAALRMA